MYTRSQIAVLQQVADRLRKEVEQQSANVGFDDTLLWCTHGTLRYGKVEGHLVVARIVRRVRLANGARVPDGCFAGSDGTANRR